MKLTIPSSVWSFLDKNLYMFNTHDGYTIFGILFLHDKSKKTPKTGIGLEVEEESLDYYNIQNKSKAKKISKAI